MVWRDGHTVQKHSVLRDAQCKGKRVRGGKNCHENTVKIEAHIIKGRTILKDTTAEYDFILKNGTVFRAELIMEVLCGLVRKPHTPHYGFSSSVYSRIRVRLVMVSCVACPHYILIRRVPSLFPPQVNMKVNWPVSLPYVTNKSDLLVDFANEGNWSIRSQSMC